MANSVPWCWADKQVLRKIRASFDSQNTTASALAVYHALTESASDAESDEFRDSTFRIAHRAGLSQRTTGERIQDLERIGAIAVNRPRVKAPSTFKLLPFSNDCPSTSNGCRSMRDDCPSTSNGCATFGKPEAPLVADIRRTEEQNLSHTHHEGGAATPMPSIPSLDEVKFFCASSGIAAPDAEWFYHKCEGSNWTNDGKPIHKWKSTLLAWKLKEFLPSQKSKNGISRSGKPLIDRNAGTLNAGGSEAYRDCGRVG